MTSGAAAFVIVFVLAFACRGDALASKLLISDACRDALDGCSIRGTDATAIEVGNASAVRELKGLTVDSNERLVLIGDLRNLTGLHDLTVSNNQLLVYTPRLNGLANLARLEYRNLPAVTHIGLTLTSTPGLTTLKLEGLGIDVSPDTAGCHGLLWYELRNNFAMTRISTMITLPALAQLFIFNNAQLESIEDIPPRLKWLDVFDNAKLRALPALTTQSQMETLRVHNNSALAELPSLSGLSGATDIEIGGNQALTSVPSLATLTSAHQISIKNNHVFTRINTTSIVYLIDHTNPPHPDIYTTKCCYPPGMPSLKALLRGEPPVECPLLDGSIRADAGPRAIGGVPRSSGAIAARLALVTACTAAVLALLARHRLGAGRAVLSAEQH